jgi:hypothetical protein
VPVMPQDITQVVNQESSKLGEQGRLEPTIRTTFRVRSQGPFSIELPKAGGQRTQRIRRFRSMPHIL